jgi:diguanylate cyclase (GGDEF)-like protein
MRQEVARSRRTGRPFAVMLVDMNGLKRINDQFGHMAGSRAICRVADVLRRCCRETDLAARFGGDEFALVLSETADEGGRIVLDRICARLAADETTPRLSVSGGHAVFPRDGDSPTLLLRAADSMLYAEKHKETTGTEGTKGTTGTMGTTGTSGATGATGTSAHQTERHQGHSAA